MDFPGLLTKVDLAPFTTFKLGGPADYFIEVNSQDDLVKAVRFAIKNDLNYFLLGTGANILVGDKGFRGLVIRNRSLAFAFDGPILVADSGVEIAQLIEISISRGLSGLEHFAGIPSSVGGALWQNLHFLSPDRTTTLYIDAILESAKILDETGNLLTVDHAFFQFDYDYSILHQRKLVALEATFKLSPEDNTVLQNRAQANLDWRRQKHPPIDTRPSAGSVFKKIEAVGAGRLIEAAGLKGHTIGGAQVSPQHANFIVNLGSATASDVRALISLIQTKVKDQSGYSLEPEISFIGEF